MSNCIFCSIIDGDIPSHKIYSDEYTYAFLDISCQYEGHTLVVPRTHCVNILDCDNEVLAHVMNTVKLIGNHYVNNCGYDAVNVLVNNGEASGQMVGHLHVHIIPRKNNDGLKVLADGEKQQLDLGAIANKLALSK